MDAEEYNKAKQALTSINTNTRLDEEQRLKYQLNLLDAVVQRYRTVQRFDKIEEKRIENVEQARGCCYSWLHTCLFPCRCFGKTMKCTVVFMFIFFTLTAFLYIVFYIYQRI